MITDRYTKLDISEKKRNPHNVPHTPSQPAVSRTRSVRVRLPMHRLHDANLIVEQAVTFSPVCAFPRFSRCRRRVKLRFPFCTTARRYHVRREAHEREEARRWKWDEMFPIRRPLSLHFVAETSFDTVYVSAESQWKPTLPSIWFQSYFKNSRTCRG